MESELNRISLKVIVLHVWTRVQWPSKRWKGLMPHSAATQDWFTCSVEHRIIMSSGKCLYLYFGQGISDPKIVPCGGPSVYSINIFIYFRVFSDFFYSWLLQIWHIAPDASSSIIKECHKRLCCYNDNKRPSFCNAVVQYMWGAYAPDCVNLRLPTFSVSPLRSCAYSAGVTGFYELWNWTALFIQSITVWVKLKTSRHVTWQAPNPWPSSCWFLINFKDRLARFNHHKQPMS